MTRSTSIASLALLLLVLPASAQTYAGTFAAANDYGGQTVISLRQTTDGSIVGDISGNGNVFQLEGVLEDGSLVGAVSMGQQGGVWFEADLHGNQLELTLIEPDANGMPNYSTATTLQFFRTGMAPTGAGAAVSGGKPGKGRREAAGSGAGRAGSGASSPVGGQPTTHGSGALDDGTATGREWSQWLAGNKVTKMDSYSSGSSGGYSMRIDTHLCSTGEFAMYDQSSMSVDVGGASGYSGSNGAETGRWRIITQGQLVGIELRYNSGQSEVYQLTYEDGATYADGERVYVTPSDVCR